MFASVIIHSTLLSFAVAMSSGTYPVLLSLARQVRRWRLSASS